MSSWEKVSEIVFIVGIAVSIFVGAVHWNDTQTFTLLMFMGIFVGLINIFGVSLKRFLTATVSMLVGTLSITIISNFMRTDALVPLLQVTSSLSLFLATIVIVISGVEIYKIIAEKHPKEKYKVEEKKKKEVKKKTTKK